MKFESGVPNDISQLKICGLLDELSENYFPYECKFLNLDYNCWRQQIDDFKPNILFVESIWNGYNKTWRRKLTPIPDSEFKNMIKYCKERNIPTVFWNKEDPIHFGTFLHVASYFDIVFTTDLDCIPLYKRLLGHDQVYCLPFATSAQMFPPIEKYTRKDGACFAGSYYNKQEERKKDFERIVDFLIKKGNVEIYDRNPYPGNPDYEYPDKYKSLIVGTLPPEKVDIAYKSYKLGITLNIVKHSSTMFARRAVELLSSNTLVISNDCRGLKNLFGDLIIYYDDHDKFEARLDQLLSDEILYEKLKLKALRKVLKEHTYKDRIAYIYELVFKRKPKNYLPRVVVYTIVNNQEEMDWVIYNYKRQQYIFKKIYIFTTNELPEYKQKLEKDIEVYSISQMSDKILEEAEYCAFFSPRNYYGENYLTDLVLSLKYEKLPAVGKGCYYTYRENGFHLVDNEKKYVYTTSLKIDRSIISVEFMKSQGFFGTQEGDIFINGIPCLSIDPYNFCEGYTQKKCNLVDDIEVNEGLSMDEIINISEVLKATDKYYEIPLSLSGYELFNRLNAKDKNVFKMKFDNGVGLGYSGEKISDVFIEKKFEVLKHQNKLTMYYNATINGTVNVFCAYYDNHDKYLGSYLLLNKGCTTIPIAKNAKYYKLYIRFEGASQIILKEILINPSIKDSILGDIFNEILIK